MTEQPQQQASTPYSNDWRWNSQAPPPISGQVRTDTRDWATATHVYISNKTDANLDVGATLAQIVLGSNLDLSHRADATRTVRYTVRAAPVAQAAYVDVPVTYVQSAGTLPVSGTLCTLAMVLPSGALTITWKIEPVLLRGNRYLLTCTCPHGSVSELCATQFGAPAPIQGVIGTTATNLVRRTGCTCTGLTQGAAAQDEAEAEVAGL